MLHVLNVLSTGTYECMYGRYTYTRTANTVVVGIQICTAVPKGQTIPYSLYMYRGRGGRESKVS